MVIIERNITIDIRHGKSWFQHGLLQRGIARYIISSKAILS